MLETDDGYVLIFRHKSIYDGWFSSELNITGVENAGDSSANTYCIIGLINSTEYRSDEGYFELKLVYNNTDATNSVLKWTQTSWITEPVIEGADLSLISDIYAGQAGGFLGLGLSASRGTYLDGSGADDSWWYVNVF